MIRRDTRTETGRAGRRRRAALAVLLAGSMALVACGGDDGGGGGATDTTANSGTGSTGGGTTTVPASDRPEGVIRTPRGEGIKIGEPRRGGEVVYAVEGGFQRIDPAGVSSTSLSQIGTGVFGNLMTQDDEGNIIPGMALSMESDDFITWTMKLRPEVKFSDGTPFNADAVVAHITRLKDPATKYPYSANLADIIEITAQDEWTVIWKLDEAFPRFPLLLTYQGQTFVPSPAAINNPDFGTNPVGAGPFLAQSIRPDAEAVLVRNPNYWNPELPYLDKITYIPMTDSEAKLAALQTGDVDIAFTLADQDWARAEGMGIKALRQRSWTLQCTMFNSQVEPVNDPRVRRALALAIDNHTLNEVVYKGVREVPDRALPESHLYSSPTENYPTYDPEEAKRLIDEYVAEKGKPLEFDISVNIQPEFQQVWTIILQMWEQVGAKATMSIMDQAEHVAQANAGNYQVQGRYCSTQAQPDAVALNSWHSAGGTNPAKISNPIIDEALENFKASDDEEVRKREFAKATQELIDQNYYIYHTIQSNGYYVGPKIKGFPAAHPVSAGYFQAEYVWI